MKKTLGSFILFFTMSLFGSNICDYKFQVSDYNPYLKESVEIVFNAQQIDKSKVMYFDLKPHKSKDYEVHLIEKTESQKSYQDKSVTYKYILFPLKSGKIKLDFDFKVSLATGEGVEKFYTGSRDVINPMALEESMVDIKPLFFDVKSLKDVDLVGDFELQVEVDKNEASSYEQVNAIYTLSGSGYPSKLDKLLPKIDNVDSFLELQGEAENFIKGGKLLYRYALLSEKDFKIPAIEIDCFSPKKGRYYTLKTDSKKIHVVHVEAKNLLDKTDSYPTTAFDWSILLGYLNGFLLFLAGFLAAKLDFMKYLKKSKPAINPMHKKIKKAKDEKALLKLLLSSHKSSYKSYIKQLEESIYEQKKCDLSKIKDELLKQ